MPLDNAQFISELSISDPTGTDPVNQGDDQIRTTKRATQQSFPNIDAPVTLTAAQLEQAAIKNEANTFTQINTFQQALRAGNGSAAVPSYSFTNSPNMGLFRNASAQLGVAFGGIEVATFASTNFTTTLNVRTPNGTALLPSHTFASENNTGMFRDTAGRLSFSVLGSLRAILDSTQFQALAVIKAVDGSAAAPAFAFTGQPGTGMYRPGTSLGFAVNGVDAAFLLQSQLRMIADGTESLPAYSFQNFINTGFYATSNSLNSTVNGTLVWAESTNGMFAGTGFAIHADGNLTAPAKPGFAFSNDADTGMFRLAANGIGFASGGVTMMEMRANGNINVRQLAATTGITINFQNSGGFTAYSIQYEGTSGFQPRQFSISRHNPDTGAFIDIPLYIATDGRVHTALPVLSP